jgi:hypothetical protein
VTRGRTRHDGDGVRTPIDEKAYLTLQHVYRQPAYSPMLDLRAVAYDMISCTRYEKVYRVIQGSR